MGHGAGLFRAFLALVEADTQKRRGWVGSAAGRDAQLAANGSGPELQDILLSQTQAVPALGTEKKPFTL